MSEILTTADAANVLRELLPAQNESYKLGLALGLQNHEIDAIHSTNRLPEECLRDVIIKFLQQAPESKRNWRIIADSLTSPLVNHKVLAGTVKAAHFPDPTPIDSAERDIATLLNGDLLTDLSGMLESYIHAFKASLHARLEARACRTQPHASRPALTEYVSNSHCQGKGSLSNQSNAF